MRGILRKYCPPNKRKKKVSSRKHASEFRAANVTNGYDFAKILMVFNKDIQDAWIMDLGCMYHMPPNRYLLIEFKKIDGGKVLLGNHNTCDVKKTRSVWIATHDGLIKMLTNVSRVLELKINLIYLDEFDRAVYSYKS